MTMRIQVGGSKGLKFTRTAEILRERGRFGEREKEEWAVRSSKGAHEDKKVP